MTIRNRHVANNLKELKNKIASGKVTESNIAKEALKVFSKENYMPPSDIIAPTNPVEKAKLELETFKKSKPVLNKLSDIMGNSPKEKKDKLSQVFNYLNSGVNIQLPFEEMRLERNLSKAKLASRSY